MKKINKINKNEIEIEETKFIKYNKDDILQDKENIQQDIDELKKRLAEIETLLTNFK